MKALRARTLSKLIGLSLILCVTKSYSGEGTTLAISAEQGSSIAADLFPVTLKMSDGNVFLTEPRLLFRDDKRVSMLASFQAYDHRPEKGIAVSETGHAIISGRLDYDRVSRQILLHDPRIDELTFDQSSDVTQDMHHKMQTAWSAVVTNPIRSEIPAHPYTLLIKDNIQALSYDGKSINLTVLYE